MTRQQAINYLRSSGMSEEQIDTVVDALVPKGDLISGRVMTTKQKAEMYDIIMVGLKGLHKNLTSLADAHRCEPEDPENMKGFECFQYGSELAYRQAAREVEKFLEVE